MLAEILLRIRPHAQWVLRDDELEWLDKEQTEPTEEEIQAEIARLKAEYKATEYQRLRLAEYNKLNQDELRYDDMMNGTNTWQEVIEAIKAKYPKGATNG